MDLQDGMDAKVGPDRSGAVPPDLAELCCLSCGEVIGTASVICPQCGMALSADAELSDPKFRERLARALGPGFELGGMLGRGGFADVYAIHERQLDRSLAVKVLRPEIAWGPGMVSRFEREARALANLYHLSIPPVHFVGNNEGLIYYVMPLIDGRSLGELLAERCPMEPAVVVDIMLQVLDALEHAHRLGIIHRDIKPDNIIIEKGTGRPLLVDFGVAKQVRTGSSSTSLPGVILGTPGYISPEQVFAEANIDARSDIYAVGATMFHLLTGTSTFRGDTPREIIGQQMTGEIPLPTEVNTGIPGWLSRVVVCALATRPDDRFQSAAAMAEALRAGRKAGADARAAESGPVRHIRAEDSTPRMMPAFREPVTGAGQVESPWRRRSGPSSSPRTGRRPRQGNSHRNSVLLFLGAVAILAGYFVLVPPAVQVRNELLLPVELSTDDGAVRTIGPGGEMGLPLAPDGRLVARWFVVQPRPDLNRPALGEAISGSIRVDALSAIELLRRRATRTVNSLEPGNAIFAPRVSNHTLVPVRVLVNRVQGGANCDCLILPGETRLLGYYRVNDDSFVWVEERPGRTAVFRDIPARLDLTTGEFIIRVDDTIFSRPPA